MQNKQDLKLTEQKFDWTKWNVTTSVLPALEIYKTALYIPLVTELKI
jgi:hypothetical protein